MTANKHTPGPWYVGFPDGSGSGYITDGDGLVVVRGGYANGLKFGAIRKFDARLIAAAPELLEALQGVVRVADRNTLEFIAAHAAIAKATGESP